MIIFQKIIFKLSVKIHNKTLPENNSKKITIIDKIDLTFLHFEPQFVDVKL